jgi:hypothetical protein
VQRRDGGFQGEPAGVPAAERSQDQVVRLGDALVVPGRTVLVRFAAEQRLAAAAKESG